MKQNIVFFGSGDFVIPVVKRILNHGLGLVITNEKDENSALINFCKTNNIKWISTNSPTVEIINNQQSIINHSLGVLASFGAIVPDEVINFFKHGIINIHPSLLPKYKGPSPIQYAILNGESVTGVTLIKLDSELDHGPILLQKPYNLKGNETTQELLNILFEIGAEMTEELIIKLERGENLLETPQNHKEESWSYRIEKKDGYIDINSPSLKIENLKLKIDHKIRAFFPWPTVWFKMPVIASETHQSRLSGKLIKLLPEGRIQVEGKSPMNHKDFINGFGNEGKELLEKLNLI